MRMVPATAQTYVSGSPARWSSVRWILQLQGWLLAERHGTKTDEVFVFDYPISMWEQDDGPYYLSSYDAIWTSIE